MLADIVCHVFVIRYYGNRRVSICRSPLVCQVMTSGVKPAVLVVDDEPAIGRIIAVVINSLGCETITATTAEEGLEKLSNIEPKMMFVDVRLPGIDGVEFVSRIREDRRYRKTPVYLMSAFGEPSVHAGDGFLPKPFDVDQLSDIVEREVLERDT